MAWLADATKVIVVFLAIIMGLGTMGFDTVIIASSFIAILQGLVYGIALAFGLAFGLGGQDDAKDIIKIVRKKTNPNPFVFSFLPPLCIYKGWTVNSRGFQVFR